MTEREQNEKSHQVAAGWFKEHKATAMTDTRYPSLEPIIIDWRRPDTSNYAMRYIVTGRYVIVTGDVGEAIYSFGSALTLEFLARCDWHYFINKCVASETGRNYTMKIPGIKSLVPNVRAAGHYVGLQMAIKQLTASEQKPGAALK